VVLKELSPVVVGNPSDAWLRFITAVAGASHPSLGRVVDGGVRPSGALAVRWMALEPVPGRAASHRIAEGAQPLRTVVGRVRALAAALHLLHSRGVVHGGVTPGNVILRPDGGASLVGYGSAFLRRDGRLGPAPATTESDYLAPEHLGSGTIPGPASDVFGLVAVAVGMATGRPPFERTPDGGRGPVGSSGPPTRCRRRS
jgi:serine/threonine protein kinase